MSDWTRVLKLDEIPPLGARVIHSHGQQIAVFRTADDAVFALRDRCPHKGGPLSQGIVHGSAVTCPLHNWKIDLASGAALGPDEGCTPRVDCKLEGGIVYLGLAEPAAGDAPNNALGPTAAAS